jgi:hypothetical protein
LILVTGALIPSVGSACKIMGSFEDLMNERRRLQKELDEKSSRDKYARQLEATLVKDESPVVMATPSPSSVDTPFTPVLSPIAEGEMDSFDQRRDPVFLMAKEIPMATSQVGSASVLSLEIDTSKSDTDGSHMPSSEVPIFKDTPAAEMATPSSRQMATPVLPTTSPRSSLKEIQDRIHKERGLMFEDRPIPVDPQDSRRLATPFPRPKPRGSFVHQNPPSADLVSLQREMAEKRNSWMVQKESEDLAKKSLATLAYEDSLENSPFPVPVPMMPGYRSLVGPSLATNSTLQLPLDVVSGVTKRNPASWVIDMQTDRGMAMTAGLVGAGMCHFLLLFITMYRLHGFDHLPLSLHSRIPFGWIPDGGGVRLCGHSPLYPKGAGHFGGRILDVSPLYYFS